MENPICRVCQVYKHLERMRKKERQRTRTKTGAVNESQRQIKENQSDVTGPEKWHKRLEHAMP